MQTFPEYDSFDGLGLATLIKRKILSPDELLNAAIERIESLNPKINAVIRKMYSEAKDTIKNLPDGPFSGVPFLLKDLLGDYKGVPSTCGSRFTQSWIADADSEMVARFKKAGVVILGKTNTPEFGLSPVTEPVLFGPTANPWDLKRASGGSSGGSAAAVAARMVPMAHGGDGGGSIRIPSAYCGVFGFKPSRERTPTGPRVMRIWQGMVVEHVLTRSVRDSAAMLDCVAGPELGSPISLPKPEKTFLSYLDEPVRKLKIGITDQPFFTSDVKEEYKIALKKAAALCESFGHEVVPIKIEFNQDEVALAYIILMAGEMRNGLQLVAKTLNKKINYKEIETSCIVLMHVGKHFTAADFAWATYVLDMTGRKLAELFEKVDMIMTPTMPTSPPLIGGLKLEQLEEQILKVLKHIPYGPLLRALTKKLAARNFRFTPFTPLFNITGQPAMSVPLYWDMMNLPIGIQFVGKFADEASLFQLAKQLEDETNWDRKKPLVVIQNSVQKTSEVNLVG